MAKNVLLAIDLNNPSHATKPLAEALRILDPGGRLHVIAVMPDFGMSQVSGFFREGYEKDMLKAGGDQLRDWVADNIATTVDVSPHLVHGTVYDEILRAADKLEADVIVMGAHRPEFSDYLLGPNAARVVRHAKQSVYVVRN
jgi:nucleotide-binding universal stress UspA family protein